MDPDQRRATTRTGSGFTLIELVVTIGIVAIMAGIAAPSFVQMIANQRTKTIASDLFTALSRARSEAVKRNTDVALTPVSASAWQLGWFILNPDGSGAKLDDHGAVTDSTVTGPPSVIYHANGRLRGGTTPSFDISAKGKLEHRCVTVDLSGRPYLKDTGC
ncbi:MAG: GspH/FimT family pseudopilin [Pseudomonadota bacterium]